MKRTKNFSENTFLAAGTEDGEIYIWNMNDFTLHKKYPIHTACVKGVCYSPDGQKLSSCATDKTLQITDINTGMSLFKKILESSLLCLKWEDFLLLVGTESGVLYIWDIIEVKILCQVQVFEGKYF